MKIKEYKFLKDPRIRIPVAILLVLVGILGCLLPLTPGIPFLLFAIYLFSPKWFNKKALYLKEKWQTIVKKFQKKE